jgi:excisionase family DNA binding protein
MAKGGNGKGPDWLTKQEAANLIGVSIRSVERLVEHGDIKQKFMKVVGRRPIAVLDPAGVEKAKQETLEKMPPAFTEEVTALLPRAVQPDLLTTLSHSLATIQGKDMKMFLTLDEASALTGLTRTFLERLIAEGKLPAIRDRFVKVRRTDLLRL